jgi:fructuronate reductase
MAQLSERNTTMPVKRLSLETLADLPDDVALPTVDRAHTNPGIVHLGIGAFHRAHMAVMTDTVLAAGDLEWGIVGASLRSPDTRDALEPQSFLYTAAERDGDGERLRVIGSSLGVLVAPESPQALVARLASVQTRIVSLTITEKGYCLDPATGDLDIGHPDIQHDLINAHEPRTALGFVTRALALRRNQGLKPFTLLSCDNLQANGKTLKRVLAQFAGASSPDLASYVRDTLSCPSTMVDRIVPATTDIDRARIARRLGMHDAWPVVMEPYSQWMIEDDFTRGRPDWALAGAAFVRDVAPYEAMKLRLLNASHSAIAYIGALSGYQTVAEAMTDTALAGFVADMMDDEVTPTLQLPFQHDVAAYKRALLARFRNPALQHRTHQIAMDGSQKLPPRILSSIRARIAADAPFPRLTKVVAAWMRYLAGHDLAGQSYDVRDPMAETLRATVARADGDAARVVTGLMAIKSIFGDDLPVNPAFRAAVTAELARFMAGATPADLTGS